MGVSLDVNYIRGIDTVNQQFEAGFYIKYEYLPTEKDLKDFREAQAKGKRALADFVPEFIPSFNYPNVFVFIEKEQRPNLDGAYHTIVEKGHRDPSGAKLSSAYE